MLELVMTLENLVMPRLERVHYFERVEVKLKKLTYLCVFSRLLIMNLCYT